MKIVLNLLITFISLGVISEMSAQNNAMTKWTQKFGYQKSFIENKGQFVIPNAFGNPSPVLFAVDHGGTKIYFTKKGITYTFLEATKKQKDAREIEKEREEEFRSLEEYARHEKEEHQLKVRVDQVTMLWQNANSNIEVEAADATADYHSYYFKQVTGNYKNISNIKGFKKITYKNIYPSIDIEYVFSNKGGLKYSLTLHPGADPSLIKMVYDSHVTLNNGEIKIATKFGDIVDHAPLSFYKENSASVITSGFLKSGKAVSFQLGNYDHTKTVVIDPWTQTPAFTSSWDCVWECEKDASGNVYMIGGVTPMQLLKYNSTGALQWTYNTPYDTTAWLGTMATDLAGNSYVTQGSAAQIVKVNTSGGLVWSNPNPGPGSPLMEFWSIAFNCDQTKLVIGGTGGPAGPGIKPFPFIYEMNAANGNIISSLQVTGPGGGMFGQEVRSITSAKNNKYYFLTHDSICNLMQNYTSCSNPGIAIHKISNSYSFDYKCENFRYNNSGIEAICANNNFLYTQNGTYLHKRSLTTGTIIDTAIIPGGITINSGGKNTVGNSGIDIDDCGNIYVGSTNAVIKYDANLNQLASYPTTYNVYDLHVTSGGDIVVCGSTGTSATPIRTGYIETVNMGACVPMTQTCCNAGICNLGALCVNDASVTLQAGAGGTWAGAGITNTLTGVFDPAVAGPGVHSIKYTLPCGSDSINILVNSCTQVSVCISSGSLTAYTGGGTYTWASTTTSVNCSACSGGNCVPFVCTGTIVPVWTATGTTVAAPSATIFPIKVKDVVSGITYTFSSLSSLPACNVTGITDLDHGDSHALIYPNPNNGEFNIDYSFQQAGQEIVLIDILGKEVKQILLDNNKGVKKINISDLSNGVYIYKIRNKKEILFTGKINLNR